VGLPWHHGSDARFCPAGACAGLVVTGKPNCFKQLGAISCMYRPAIASMGTSVAVGQSSAAVCETHIFLKEEHAKLLNQ
jgi:hypothetical protein